MVRVWQIGATLYPSSRWSTSLFVMKANLGSLCLFWLVVFLGFNLYPINANKKEKKEKIHEQANQTSLYPFWISPQMVSTQIVKMPISFDLINKVKNFYKNTVLILFLSGFSHSCRDNSLFLRLPLFLILLSSSTALLPCSWLDADDTDDTDDELGVAGGFITSGDVSMAGAAPACFSKDGSCTKSNNGGP